MLLEHYLLRLLNCLLLLLLLLSFPPRICFHSSCGVRCAQAAAWMAKPIGLVIYVVWPSSLSHSSLSSFLLLFLLLLGPARWRGVLEVLAQAAAVLARGSKLDYHFSRTRRTQEPRFIICSAAAAVRHPGCKLLGKRPGPGTFASRTGVATTQRAGHSSRRRCGSAAQPPRQS